MKILNLKLTNYKRIALTGCENIELDFTNKKIQLILGDNGSGKSSIIRECSPFPVAKSDVTSEGGKEVVIAHYGETYKLTNYRGQDCHFIRLSDNEELNPGGTIPVQKDLIKQIFNYTPEIHSLLVGDVLFTEMGPSKRKDWITKLSDVNYDYALKVYMILKEKYRDTVGAVKIAKKKLVEATEQKHSEEEESRLREEIKLLEEEIEKQSQLRTLLNNPSQASIEDICERLNQVTNSLANLFKYHHNLYWVDLESKRQGLLSNLEYIQNEKSRQSKRIMENQNKLQEFRTLGVLDNKDIERKQIELVNEIQSLRNNIRLPIELENIEIAKDTLSLQMERLTEIFSVLPENVESYFTKEKENEYHQNVSKLTFEINELEARQIGIRENILHLENHLNQTNINCPKCGHSFDPNLTENKIKKLKEEDQQIANRIVKLNELKKTQENLLKEQNDYFSLFESFTSIVRATKVLNPFWSYLSELKYVRTAPKAILSELSKLMTDLETRYLISLKKKDLMELDKILSMLNNSNTLTITQIEELVKQSEKDYSDLIEKETVLNQQLSDVNQSIRIQKAMKENYTQAQSLLSLLENKADYEIQKVFQDSLLESIRLLQVSLGEKAKVLNDMINRREILKNMSDTLASLEQEEKTYKLLMDTLSPTDGLIAKGLLGFIKHIISLMNALIGRVWCYPMSITPPELEADNDLELDYKFPFEVLNENNRIPDIGLGSKGQREIIDLAFRIIACQYLGLNDIPIWADEFGTGLDEAHRRRAGDAIKTITNEENYSQLFMISHYGDSYGSLVNADVCVLSGNNITLPKEHNEHVRIW